MAKSRNRKLADLIVTAGVDIAGNVTFDGGSTSADLTFADGDKANFGAASDLQIYHDGSDSFIDEAGTGALAIRSNSINLQKYTGETTAVFTADGASELYYNNAKKLETTSTGVNVTGITTSDTLVLEGTGVNTTYFTGGDASVSGRQLTLSSEAVGGQNNATHRLTVPSGYGSFNVTVNGKERVKINNNGDVSFYNDASSNAVKMFWDASAQSLGIGTTAPSAEVPLTAVYNSTSQFHFGGVQAGISNNSYYNGSAWVNRNSSVGGSILQMNTSGEFNFRRAGTGANPTLSYSMTIDGSGNVGIGTTNPARRLHIGGAGHLLFERGGEVRSKDTSGNEKTLVRVNSSNQLEYGWSGAGPVKFMGGGSYTERMRIHTNANIGINDIAPHGTLTVTGPRILVQRTNDDSSIAFANNATGAPSSHTWAAGLNYSNSNAFTIAYGASGVPSLESHKMVINTSGNVGIGTPTPGFKLDVTGTARFTADTYHQNDIYLNDKLRHNGDVDTYLQFAGANDLRLFAGGVEHAAFDGTIVFNQSAADMDLRVESTGNQFMLYVDAGNDRIGIGHNSPVTTVHADASSGAVIRVTRLSASSSAYGQLEHDGTSTTLRSTAELKLYAGTNVRSRAAIHTFANVAGTTEYGRFDSSGNLLVGKSNTTFSNYGIELRSGNGGARFIRSNAEPVLMNRVGGDGRILGLYFAGNEIGYLGSNTAAGQTLLDISSEADANSNIRFLTYGSSSHNEVMRLTSAGNVGIGTANPSNAKLEVVATSGEVFRADSNNGAYRIVANQTGVNMQGTVSVAGKITASVTDSEFHNRLFIKNGTHGLYMGQWDTVNHRIEADANRPLTIQSYNSGGITLGISGNPKFVVTNAGVSTPAKLAVMASAPHGSYDFYNNGTSYFNGATIVDDHLSITGTNAQLTLSRTSTDQTAGFNITNNQNGGYGSGIVWNSKRADAGVLTAAEITVSGENAWNSDATSSSMMQFATRKDNTLTTHMTIRKSGNVGIGVTSPYSTLQVDGPDSAVTAHFGQGQSNGSGVFGGISLGYAENANSNYRKVAIVAKARGDGAARQDLHFLVDTVSDQNSAGLTDTKMMIDGLTGNVGIGIDTPFAKSHIKDTAWSSGAPYGTVQLIEGRATNDHNWSQLIVTDTDDSNGNGGAISFATGASSALNPFASIKGYREGTNHGAIDFYTRPSGGTATSRMRISSDGTITPGANGTQDFGSNSMRWANMYTGDLHLSNEEKGGNDIDGTTGNWTVQEGEENLYLINNKTGKKYKFALEEIE